MIFFYFSFQEVDADLQIISDIRSVTVKSLADKLLSRSFQDALWVTVNSLTNQMPSLERLTMEHMQSSLEIVSSNMQFVHHLYTRFLLLPKFLDVTRVTKNSVIPEWDDSTRHRALYFVDLSRNRILIANTPSYMSIYDVVAIVVSQILGISVILPISSILSSPDNSDMAITNVLRLGTETAISGCNAKSNILVGNELLPQDAPQVQFHPLRPFYTGEIVAWRMGIDGEKLKYGRVPQDVRPSAGQTLYRFLVETAPGETQPLLSSQVLSFRSVSMDDRSSSSLIQNNENTEENMIKEQAKKSIAGGLKSSRQVRMGGLLYFFDHVD